MLRACQGGGGGGVIVFGVDSLDARSIVRSRCLHNSKAMRSMTV